MKILYTFINPANENSSFTFTAKNDRDAVRVFVGKAPHCGFYPSEISRLIKEFLEGDMTYIMKKKISA